jgi:hypothetical protein
MVTVTNLRGIMFQENSLTPLEEPPVLPRHLLFTTVSDKLNGVACVYYRNHMNYINIRLKNMNDSCYESAGMWLLLGVPIIFIAFVCVIVKCVWLRPSSCIVQMLWWMKNRSFLRVCVCVSAAFGGGYDVIWYIFNCSCVDTRWQQYSTHLHTNNA